MGITNKPNSWMVQFEVIPTHSPTRTGTNIPGHLIQSLASQPCNMCEMPRKASFREIFAKNFPTQALARAPIAPARNSAECFGGGRPRECSWTPSQSSCHWLKPNRGLSYHGEGSPGWGGRERRERGAGSLGILGKSTSQKKEVPSKSAFKRKNKKEPFREPPRSLRCSGTNHW